MRCFWFCQTSKIYPLQMYNSSHVSKKYILFCCFSCEICNLKPQGQDQENITLLLLILVAREKDRLLQLHFSCQQVKQEIFFAYLFLLGLHFG